MSIPATRDRPEFVRPVNLNLTSLQGTIPLAFSRTSVAPATACSPGVVPGFPRPETRSWRVRGVRELSRFGTVLFRSHQQALSGLSSLSCSPFRLSRNRRGVSFPRTRASPHTCSRRWPRLLGHNGFHRSSPSELHAAPLEGFGPAYAEPHPFVTDHLLPTAARSASGLPSSPGFTPE